MKTDCKGIINEHFSANFRKNLRMTNESSILKYSHIATKIHAGQIYARVFTSDLNLSRPERTNVCFMQMPQPDIIQNGSV